MPTTHVSPDSQDDLRDIANSLLKARKVIVVTGAGISTNSGIPVSSIDHSSAYQMRFGDFRSENGLYSLISAQFDAAAQQARLSDGSSDDKSTDLDIRRPAKRRKIVHDVSPKLEESSLEMKEEIEVQLEDPEPEQETIADTIQVEGVPDDEQQQEGPEGTPVISVRTTRSTIAVAQPPSSPLSSPPPEGLNVPPSVFRRTRQSHLTNSAIPPSSSPLSSPPPVLFDPFSSGTSSENGPSRRSSTSPSEVDDTPPSNPISLSQTSFGSGKNTLPNMKGKDMFDASIWSDPLRTAVFYTFATTLRQKVRDVEPTSSHRFISHLRDRGKLVRCYTQNIDQIEEKVGLSTCLNDGPGSRGRFSRKSTANINQLNRMVDEVNAMTDTNSSDKSQQSSDNETSQHSQFSQPKFESTMPSSQAESDQCATDEARTAVRNLRRDLPKSGVECVFLHGSLELLRCFLCGRVCSWDDDDRQLETMSGQQPECPHCVGATVAREERGKRALGVGKLRPDIVLYGEEHPNAHLISPIVTHDLALCPDLLLILGTSLRVHGLKVMVREFAKAVHAKGGKVVFVNYTKPPESSWGDVIDYWVEWDCDAWVSDLQDKIPKLWQTPEPPKLKKKRESSGVAEDGDKSETKRPVAVYPAACRDTKATGAYWAPRIVKELHRITGYDPLETPVSTLPAIVATTETPLPASTPLKIPQSKPDRVRTRAQRSRKSAPGVLERSSLPPSTLNPNHGRTLRSSETVPRVVGGGGPSPESHSTPPDGMALHESSIANLVKSRARERKRKKIDGEEVVLPSKGGSLRLAPLRPQPRGPREIRPFEPLPTMEVKLSPNTPKPYSETGQLQSLSPVMHHTRPLTPVSHNTRKQAHIRRSQASFLQGQDAATNTASSLRPEKSHGLLVASGNRYSLVMKPGTSEREAEAAMALSALSQGGAHPVNPQDFVIPPSTGLKIRKSARLIHRSSTPTSS
ncbi:NAD-dependent histone deacetylase HST3 [Fusarium beomiforme]|uniref:NAD-dependent histone deacetylase HST3 n=1 Tax=Fusarium beomiforme TaxID=44412 RepID=A0A9P5AMJ2_9HYPO|nr:NAD-dependent histone deacetylase HST3 [Fusarium beomiforme]